MSTNTVRIGNIFKDLPFTSFQYRICIFCFLVCFLDGFDLTIIGVTLPKIAEYLGASHEALGFALGAGQFGPLVGAIFLGMLADRLGRKWMLCVSVFIFGIFTLLTPTISDAGQLGLYRFLAGIGLGGAIPNGLAIASEYAPAKSRSFIVATMYAGMPAGAMTGGFAAAYIIPNMGWQHMYYLGGWAPIVLGCFIAPLLPESLEFLASRGKLGDQEKIRSIVAKISPDIICNGPVRFINTVAVKPGVPIKRLFTEGRAATTLLLWIVCSGALYLLWVLNTWSPTLLKNSGATVQQYSFAYSLLCFGAMISSLFVGWTMDRINPFRVLQTGFVFAAFSLIAFGIGAESGSFAVIAILSVVCGIFINGSQTGTLAVATLSYPADIRATAIGWAYAVAKIGAMMAPVAGGYMLAAEWPVTKICSANALMGFFTAVMVFLLHYQLSGRCFTTSANEEEQLRVLTREVGAQVVKQVSDN
ncbi:MFS transporter [Desulforhopalus singaporensis]|uniref:MFS transporter, AAHS family, 4-hydroxybenzoate transporter n=1 Tax=Desulforhopalus singaporensis TaxID=91360 RepID=A0A1H0P0D9_9BACT|nr:MFS transporter [Desulforhopalus singaporensis]SDO98226.1 MFS transporter, AAHS family, 4-hydroxybenzoate transporter [Desulforhopalus singaporensis]